jgi:hypothetical protein
LKVKLTIYGEPCSKANSRRLVHIPDGHGGKRASFVKSKDALAYERDALRQIPPVLRHRLEGPVRLTLCIYYASERPDLDESIVMDVMQDRYAKDKKSGKRELVQKGIYRNDRQVREKHAYWGKDPRNPRAEIVVEALVPQQVDLIDARPAAPAGAPF